MMDEMYQTRLVGNEAPEWTANAIVGNELKELKSSDFDGQWKVLFFYPLDFTFVCPTEITAFEAALSKFKELNCQVIGCSVDSQFSHLAWNKQHKNEGGLGGVSFPILSDITKEISWQYGVLMEDAGVALRGLFVIDDKNVIQHTTINNLGVGRNVDEVLRLVEAFQFVAKNGQVCPAGWTSGKATMTPDPVKSQDYFKEL